MFLSPYRLIPIVGLLMCLAGSVRADIAPPPRPPAGWKAEATPGFEPGLEASVVELLNSYYPTYSGAMDERIEALWASWGEKGVEPLIRLSEDESWEGFRRVVVRLLGLSPYESARDYLADLVRDTSEDGPLQNLARGMLPRYHPEFAFTLFAELLESEALAARRRGIQGMLSLHTRESLAAAKAAVDKLPPSEQEGFRRSIEYVESYVRANEPMSLILKKEKEKGS